MHEELDKALVPYISGIRTIQDYTQLLVAFYGFFKPVYDSIDAHLDVYYLPDYPSRRKPEDILQNLRELDAHDPATQICRQVPSIQNNAGAFGALYVMEGSTLGGLMIKKMLTGQLSLSDKQLQFFGGYGKQTRQRWNVFLSAMNTVAQNETEEQALIETAKATFTCFRNWLSSVYFTQTISA